MREDGNHCRMADRVTAARGNACALPLGRRVPGLDAVMILMKREIPSGLVYGLSHTGNGTIPAGLFDRLRLCVVNTDTVCECNARCCWQEYLRSIRKPPMR
jgi:hypothetical protein